MRFISTFSNVPRSEVIKTLTKDRAAGQGDHVAQRRARICVVVAIPMTLEVFLLAQLKALQEFYDVTVIANCPDAQFLRKLGLDIDLLHVAIERDISPFQDAKCLIALFRLFRSHQFSVVHSITPKAGLLAMVAARLARIPNRMHTFTGQVWVGLGGWKRGILKQMDRILAESATELLADSYSQLKFLRDEGIVSTSSGVVLGKGSISGVDRKRFHPRPIERQRIRQELGLADSVIVFGFIGRLKKDKGVLDLAQAFRNVCKEHESVHLLVVGPDEERLMQRMIALAGEAASSMSFVSWTKEPEHYMASIDLLCLPSYREGFGSVIIEAAACGVPALASRIYGVSDALIEGVTGMMHECGDVGGIADGLKRAVAAGFELGEMGFRAQQRANEDFDSSILSSELVARYRRVLGERTVA